MELHTGDLVLLGVLVGVAVFLVLATRTTVPYPILLVLGGTGLAFVPGVDQFHLDPDIVLIAFLPPLLYSVAFFASLQDLRDNVGPIAFLAVGLVTATMVAVAVVAHELIDGMSWPTAFVLGAVVSPTDPVAVGEIAARVRAPRRLVTIAEGESLVNDATGLVAYKFAVAAVLTGTFSLGDAFLEFVLGAAGGVAIGLLVGRVIAMVRKALDDPPTEIAISLITPYLAYLPAEALGLSAVLAAVTSGLYLGWRSPELITPATRIQAFAFWEVLQFALNAVLFVLIGLQLHTALDALEEHSAGELALYAAVVAATVMVIRLVWIFPFAYLPRLSRRIRESRAAPNPKVVGLLGWTGMRGAVSLAAALAIPLQTDAGAPFPDRELIIFLAYAVIVTTVVLQGLTLPPLIGAARVYDDEETVAEQEAQARAAAAEAALKRLDELAGEDWVREETHDRMRSFYEFRKRRYQAQLDEGDDGELERGSLAYQQLRRKVLEAERAEMIRLRNRGAITDDTMRKIERDLDLEDARLEI